MAAIRKLLSTTPYPQPFLFRRSQESLSLPASARQASPSPIPSATGQSFAPALFAPIPLAKTPTIGVTFPVVTDAKARCPLERLNLQPVGMSAHYLDRCYCYLCKCGEHQCPGELRKGEHRGNRKGWKSHYKETYTGREVQRVKGMKPEWEGSLPRPTQMDLKTTQQMDFRPPNTRAIVLPKRQYEPNGIKLVSRTSYQRDFPDWKPCETVCFKPKELPYRGDLVTFKSKSTYQDEFVAERPAEHFSLRKGQKRPDPIAVLSDFYGTSSSKLQYKAPLESLQTEKPLARGNVRNYSDLAFSPPIRSLTTTYQAQFPIKEQTIQPPTKRQAHRSLSHNSLPSPHNS